jgi:GNAT superfamily N-acetyltransferase
MLSSTCECGFEMTGADRDEQVAVAHAHFTEKHPEYGVTATQCRNYLEREEMLSPETERQAEIGPVEVVAISPDRVNDILTFFDRDAFADNAGWAPCYCMAHHVPGGEGTSAWRERTWQQNRDDLAARIRSGATTGAVAYDGGRIVAWCNASARCQYPEYAKGDGRDADTGVVACFAVAPTHRGHGLATRLLSAAVEQFRATGVDPIEAHPATDPKSPGAAYRGTTALYERAGFEGPDADGTMRG